MKCKEPMRSRDLAKWIFRRLKGGHQIFCNTSILDEYVKAAPNDQNALDIFVGEWSSKMPAKRHELRAGQIPLFEDERIVWAEKQIGGFRDCKILELGPLEAGHTYMLETMGAKSILSIEANTHAYLKCLIAKEVLQLKCTRFLLGDFVSYLKTAEESFDICLASGVLYHTTNPAELIYLISRISKKVIIWTHYYDQEIIRRSPNLLHRFLKSQPVMQEYRGFKHTLHKYLYKDALVWTGFCGGGNPYSHWMSKDDILSCLNKFGFDDLRIGLENPAHPNGPSFCVVGQRAHYDQIGSPYNAFEAANTLLQTLKAEKKEGGICENSVLHKPRDRNASYL
jgi:hypothetical protein